MGAQFACGNHLQAVAEFYCPTCDKHLCKDCTTHLWVARGFVDQCVACKAMLQHIGAKQVTAPGAKKAGNPDTPLAGARAFLEQLPAILSYPFKTSVLFTIAGLALLTAPLMWATGNNISGILGLIGFFFILGLEIMIYFQIVMRTAHGEEEMESPDFDNVFDDFFAPVGRYILALSPIIAGMFVFGEAMLDNALLGALVLLLKPSLVFEHNLAAVLFCSGVILLPLLTASAALGRSASAVLNPALWIQNLKIMWATYPIAVAAYYVVLAFDFLVFRELLFMDLAPSIPIPILGTWLIVSVSYLPMVLRARILGAMCRPYLRDLD